MTVTRIICSVLFTLVLLPSTSRAQTGLSGSIAGVVKDSTGSVLPGVTVEATSPALIEKLRTVVSDSQGQYKIVDLRPGVYVVTFSLSGFSNVRREGIELTTGFTAPVNAELVSDRSRRLLPSPARAPWWMSRACARRTS